MIIENTIYKKDKNGNTRTWWVEYSEEGYLTKSGVLGGAIVTSGITKPNEKNVGKSNSTTVAEQVKIEVEALYKYQLHQGKYHETIDTINNGAAFIECQLADTFKAKKHNQYPYIGQPKFDGCISGDTTLITENGKKKAMDVYQDKDKFILSRNLTNGKDEMKPILDHLKDTETSIKTPKWYIIKTSTGKELKVTENHLIYLPELDVWRSVDNLVIGDKLLEK